MLDKINKIFNQCNLLYEKCKQILLEGNPIGFLEISSDISRIYQDNQNEFSIVLSLAIIDYFKALLENVHLGYDMYALLCDCHTIFTKFTLRNIKTDPEWQSLVNELRLLSNKYNNNKIVRNICISIIDLYSYYEERELIQDLRALNIKKEYLTNQPDKVDINVPIVNMLEDFKLLAQKYNDFQPYSLNLVLDDADLLVKKYNNCSFATKLAINILEFYEVKCKNYYINQTEIKNSFQQIA